MLSKRNILCISEHIFVFEIQHALSRLLPAHLLGQYGSWFRLCEAAPAAHLRSPADRCSWAGSTHPPCCARARALSLPLPLPPRPQVMALMGMEKGGPALGQLMERVMDWQLCHPHGTADECREHLLANYSGSADMQLK